MPALDARAVDEEADLVAVLEDLGREGSHLVGLGQLSRVDPCLAANLLNGLLRGRGGGVPLQTDSSVKVSEVCSLEAAEGSLG